VSAPFRVVVAPDKFKGSLRSDEVARTITAVLERDGSSVDVVQHPMADGGEGTVELALSTGFSPVTVEVEGPLGAAVTATFALREGVAVLEMASAAGIGLLPVPPDRDTARAASTYGVGQLIVAALDHGGTRVVVGAGGSATTDGGAGAVAALGVDVSVLGRHPVDAERALRQLDPRLADVELVVACDVDNPLLGRHGAAAVYAPQKGADDNLVRELDARLSRWADAVAEATSADHRDEPGSGAAGGLAFGLVALAGARIVSGVELLLELTGFADVVATADLVVVGEGSLDEQSLRGKGPLGVARAASGRGIPVIAVVGRNQLTTAQAQAAGLSQVYALSDLERDVHVSMRDAQRLVARVSEDIVTDWMGPGPGPSRTAGTTGRPGEPVVPTAAEYREALLSTVRCSD
jgi:glycerate kinase